MHMELRGLRHHTDRGMLLKNRFQMQSIFHHNSSGNRAFSGSLKRKEVHSAITLHPIKRSPLMHRMYAYYLGLTAQELRQQSLYLHRDIAQMISLLQIPKTHRMLARGVPLFPENDNDSFNFVGDHDILGRNSWRTDFGCFHTNQNLRF